MGIFSRVRSRNGWLIPLVILAGVLSSTAILALLSSSLSAVTTKADEIAARRDLQATQALADISVDRVRSLAAEISERPMLLPSRPAAAKAGAPKPPEAAWDDDKPFDGVFVLDDKFRVTQSYFRGHLDDALPSDLLASTARDLFSAHQAEIARGKPFAGWGKTAYGVTIVGFNRLPLYSVDGQTKYMAVTRHFTPAYVKSLGQSFRMSGLKLTIDADTANRLPLKDAAGKNVAYLAWTSQRPGPEAAVAAIPQVTVMATVMGAILVFFVGLCIYALRKLEAGEDRSRKAALTDGLSGLPNRRALLERLQAVTAHDRVANTVMFIDLDGFKNVNDLYGHDIGDLLIKRVAEEFANLIPEGAMLSRLGGDEFAVLILGPEGLSKSNLLAEQILSFVKNPLLIGDRTIKVGASLGIAQGELTNVTPQDIFRRADMAMYHSKMEGKGRVTHYNAEIESARFRIQEMEDEIRTGLARDEFDVVYQPIVDSGTGTTVAVEALARWPRRPAGAIDPEVFIPVAETSGLIHALGLSILRKACEDLSDQPHLHLSVNVSPVQFRDPMFEQNVAKVVEETGFGANRLELEVTEAYLIENPERAIEVITKLKSLGITIALDDFGTGYSSIGYLQRYNFDKIKIDRSLASRVDRDPQTAALIAGAVSIANALSISVTAEGVETEDQSRLLRLAGCDQLQGFLYSRPAVLSDITTKPSVEAPDRSRAAG